jgi:hypothetical protein
VWLIDAVMSVFTTHTDEARMQYFRMGVGAACALKFAIALSHGGWTRLAPGGFARHDLDQRHGPHRATLVARWYRPILCVRLAAALLLTGGVAPKAAALAVIGGLLFELLYEYRSNTVFLALMTSCLLVAGNPGDGLYVVHRMSDANTWAQFLVVLIVTDVYWNSAWQKTRSAHYMSGLLLAQYVHFTGKAQEKLRFREFFYPRLFLRWFGGVDAATVRRWRVVALAVILVEVALPVALALPASRPYAIAVGVCMHAAFLLLLPRPLLGFSLGTVASYVAFVP